MYVCLFFYFFYYYLYALCECVFLAQIIWFSSLLFLSIPVAISFFSVHSFLHSFLFHAHTHASRLLAVNTLFFVFKLIFLVFCFGIFCLFVCFVSVSIRCCCCTDFFEIHTRIFAHTYMFTCPITI